MPPTHIDVRVGNICNLKCIHCWTGNSSKWYEDKNMLDKYENTSSKRPYKEWISEEGDIWKYIRENIDRIDKLSFLGGEPLASKEHNNLLKWLNLMLPFNSVSVMKRWFRLKRIWIKMENMKGGIQWKGLLQMVRFV